ncbi:DUF6708 domain-containing protein [Lysobacter arvi]|uniref:DUF6708 domain-containing protein n=1 Tax=Lysobacter arvi TaxID=3038776 RepID=UPI00283A956D|nr:DUF6708 domain-containing protein [Lysobacter arvi]
MLEAFGDPPNHRNEIYLEFPRASFMWRGIWVIGGLVCVAASASLAGLLTYMYISRNYFPPAGIGLTALATIAVLVCIGGGSIRQDISCPLDEPIRFNRLRRKVYVYRFHYRWGRPFNSALWYVKPEVYDWDDLRAEVYQIYVPTVAYNSGVNIAVVKPGTNQVIDRFFFGHGLVPANYWKMAIAFMQSGPDALPKFDRPPRDWNNEDPGINLARRFAPKVKWPEAMDVESRTAP